MEVWIGERREMLRNAVSGIMLALLLISSLMLAFNFQPVKSEPGTLMADYGLRSDFHKMEDSVDDIYPGDSILVNAGLHHLMGKSEDLKPVFIPGEVLVKFKTSISADVESIDKLNKRFRVSEMRKVLWNVYKLTFQEDVDVFSVAAQYASDSNVEYAEPNYIFHTCITPNDADYKLQWAHQVIESERAWDIETGDPKVVIAIVDTGVDWSHPDLAANIWNNTDEVFDGKDNDDNGFVDDVRGWDFVDTAQEVYGGEDGTERDNDPMDFAGHGTHCAGIAAAVTNNSIGIAGMSWNCKIMPVRAGYLRWDGAGCFELDDAVAAIKYAADNGANIISMSWGSYEESKLLHEAVKYAYGRGVLLVAAAGNEHTDWRLYPAAYGEVIAVTATNNYDWPAWFTNYGDWVELAAPGVDIYSTFPIRRLVDYATMNGTSMSTPFVAGVAALIWSRFPDMTRDRVRLQLWCGTDDLGDSGYDEYYGFGRINARKALEEAPPTHDIYMISLDAPPGVKPGGTARVKTTIANHGKSDEINVMLKLLVNGTHVDSASISSLTVGSLTTTTLLWTPILEGVYNITVYLPPVSGEEVIFNNVLSTYVVVREAKVLRVPEDFTTIQEAIDAATSGIGDKIYVKSGVYHEKVVVNKTISLVGEDRNATIIDGSEFRLASEILVDVTANNVNFSGFTIRNATISMSLYFVRGCNISDNMIANSTFGIKLEHSMENTLMGNYITKNEGGVCLDSCYNNTVRGNNVAHNNYGITLVYSSNNSISGNNITNNNVAMYLYHSSNNSICGNNLIANGDGVWLQYSSNSSISGNDITANNVSGIFLYGSLNTRISGNNITNNVGIISVGVLLIYSSYTSVSQNDIANNQVGIALLASSNNIVSGNNITANRLWGVNLPLGIGIHVSSKSNYNTISDNKIEGNVGTLRSVASDASIRVEGSLYNNISNNRITGNDLWGVVLGSYAQNNTISNNTIENNLLGIRLEENSYYNNLNGNTVTSNIFGIEIFHAPFNFLRGNTMLNNTVNLGVYGRGGIFFWIDYIQDIDASNTVNKKPVYYLLNESNLIVDPSTFPEIGYLAVILGNNITLRNLTLSTRNAQGLLLYNVSNSVIESVSTSFNLCGMMIKESSNNTIKGCAITNNIGGIYLQGDNNKVNGNTISNNGEVYHYLEYGGWREYVYGISMELYGSNNVIYHNNFIDNIGWIVINGAGNSCDDGYPSGGNYWSDYNGTDFYRGAYQNVTGSDGIGDTPYSIPVRNQDRYPLMKPFLYYEHDLAVSLRASHHLLMYGTPAMIEATVYNLGLSRENSVELKLLIDDDIVGSVVISELASGSTYTLNYTWTPTFGDRRCNVMAHVTPVPGENITGNNIASTPVLVYHIHDVAIVSVTPSAKRFSVEIGQVIDIEVVVKNNGTAVENVYVNAYRWITEPILEEPIIGTQIIANLAPGAEATLKFSLNTTGMRIGVNYTIAIVAWLAELTPPFDEWMINYADNWYEFVITVLLSGDLNKDGVVNMLDIGIFGKAYGSYPGHPRWNPVADIDGNGIINIMDGVKIAKNFGKTYK